MMKGLTSSLRFRLVTAFLLVSLPPMVFAAQLASRAVATAFEQNVATWLGESSAYFINNMRDTEQEAVAIAQYISVQTPAIAQIIDEHRPLPQSIAHLIDSIGYDFLAIYDSDHQMIYSSRPITSMVNLQLSSDHSLSRVEIDQRVFIMSYGLHPFEYKDKTYYILLGTWFDEEDLGALAAVSDLELRLYYRDENGYRAFFSSRDHTPGLLDPDIAEELENGAGSHYDRNAENGRYIGLFTALRGSDGQMNAVLFCGLRSYETLTTWINRTNLFLIILVTGTALAVLAGIAVSRRLTRPLQALAIGVKAVARGDYRQRVKIDGRDEVAELATAFNDMAERLAKAQELEGQLRRQQRLSALGEVAVGIAHEVRNPLGVIKTSAQLLQKRGHLPETDNRLLSHVADEVRRIDDLISEFLTFARPRPSVLQPLDPLPVVRRAADFCGPEFEKRHVTLTVQDHAPGSSINADEDHLFQVFLNLFLNAVEAMPNGGNIRVVRDQREGEMLIAVSDTGAGIPRDIQDKIFNPFFTTKEHGSGLGLAKVFTIMESHHGRVELNSAHARGTTFTLIFPLTVETPNNAAHHPAG
jgi:two-component system sensor histidine kinase HydH